TSGCPAGQVGGLSGAEQRNSCGCERVCPRTGHLHNSNHSQRREYSRHGAVGHGLHPEDLLCPEHHRGHPLLSLQQAVQDEEERIHCLQAASIHASRSW
ncbi:unnamed protein product, partial [Tetraodon nigroviridis]